MLVVVAAILAAVADDAVACPMCKAALGSQDRSHGDLVGGFFWSILFMLSMPFVIFGSLTTYMYVLVRRARREREQREAASAVQDFVDGPLEPRRHLCAPAGDRRAGMNKDRVACPAAPQCGPPTNAR